MSSPSQSRVHTPEEPGIAEFKRKWSSLQGKYKALTDYVFKLSEDMLAKEKIRGHPVRRPGGTKTLDSAVVTLQKKVVVKRKHFPRLEDVIEELDDLAGVMIATTSSEDWPRVTAWIRSNFVDHKTRKSWQGDQSVYKQTQPVFQNYTAQHFRVLLGPEFLQARRDLKGLVIEIQLKTEDTASFNSIQHDVMYKPTGTISKEEEQLQDVMVGACMIAEMMKSIEITKLQKQTLPFTDDGAWRVLKVMMRHGMKLYHVQFLLPLWLALQLCSLDNSRDLENLCQNNSAGTGQDENDKRNGEISLPLFGHGAWSITVALKRQCLNSINETIRVVGKRQRYQERYRAWVLANTFVGLHSIDMNKVIWDFLAKCGYPSSMFRMRCSSLLEFLPFRASTAPAQESRETLKTMWENLGSARSNPHFRRVMDLVEMGVYPRLCAPSYDSSPIAKYMRKWVHDKVCHVFWPAELGKPPARNTKLLSQIERNPRYKDNLAPSDAIVAYLPRHPGEQDTSTGNSGQQATYQQQQLDWVRVQWDGLSEHWDWTTLAGSSLEDNQTAIRKLCCAQMN